MIADFGAHLAALLDGSGWTIEGSADAPWCRAEPPTPMSMPTQGWKLHLSASVHTATTVLERALPVLVSTSTTFKVASTMQMLVTLNQGQAGYSQIGKFMTVYPPDADAAVDVARRLDEVLADLDGPVVPSDRTLREGGVVRYRYGGFSARRMQMPSGEVVPLLETPAGDLVPDTRSWRDSVPDWVTDPFEAAGLVQPTSPPPVLVADRFRPVSTLHRSPNSSVFLAVDLDALQRCVLKRATIDDDPWGPAARLQHEHRMLDLLADVPGVVNAIGWFEDGDERALALEDIPGRAPSALGGDHFDRAFSLPHELVAEIGGNLAAIVAELHRLGVVHRDIKPTNVILQDDGTTRLIDLELAAFADGTHARGFGTLGYLSPEQARGEAPDPADDVYSIGATMFSLAIGSDISARPAHARHRLDGLVLDMPIELAEVIERCLAPSRADRYADAGEVLAALDALGTLPPRSVPDYGASGEVPADATTQAAVAARRLHEAVIADAVATPTGATWVSRHPATSGMPGRDVNAGAAGTLLAIVGSALVLDDAGARPLIESAAAWLDAEPRLEGPLLGGLYVGEGGVVTALLRAGRFLGDDALVESALRRSSDIAALPHGSPDLFNGTAGRLRAHLWLAQATGDRDALDAALAAGHHLVATADRPAAGRATWTVLPEFGGGQQLGYAHGAAGIADTLLDLAEHTGDDALLATALDSARWIIDQATPHSNGAVSFPSEFGERDWAPLWCHGAVGIGRLLVHLHRSGHLAADDHWLLRATGVAATRHGRTLGPVVCHGIAGSIDHLLDLHQIDPSGDHLREAWSLVELLREFHVEGHDGHLRTLSDHPGVTTPDLTVGYAGIAGVWLRLADPALPTLLTGQPGNFWG